MSSGEVRKVSCEDIQLVQNLIERCLQLYMSQKEVVNTLLEQAKIEPGFTELVWQKLEEENQDFFKAYHLRLILKDQIAKFNRLLERQVELMYQICPPGVSIPPMVNNGTNIPPLHQNPTLYTPDQTGPNLKPENMHHSIGSNLSDAFINGGPSLHGCMPTASDISVHAQRIGVSPMMLSTDQRSNMGGMMQVTNGGMIKSESGYLGGGGAPFIYGGGGGGNDNGLERCAPALLGDQATFRNVDSNSQPVNEPIMDIDPCAYRHLRQIPRNFSLSDLTADFNSSSEILENYSRSPFLTDNFMGPHGGGEHQGDANKLGSISEGLSHEDFGSSD